MPHSFLPLLVLLLVSPTLGAGEVFLGETETHVVRIEVEGDRVVDRWEVPREDEARIPDEGLGFHNSLGMHLTWIPPGGFVFGVRPGTRVEFSQGYWMGAHEVTQDEYGQIAGRPPARFQGDRRPVERVTWDEARDFARRLTGIERALGRIPAGWEYRLPAEAEWEYAARAGTEGGRFLPGRSGTALCEDELLARVAWFCGTSRTDDPADHDAGRWSLKGQSGFFGTHPVGHKHPNPWGLHDVYGNVEEWCLDAWSPDLSEASEEGRARGDLARPGTRVVRGGSWLSAAYRLRSTTRRGVPQDLRRADVGFRLVLAPKL
jgi:formylglycine-generating enzyme required for sulfatase activity